MCECAHLLSRRPYSEFFFFLSLPLDESYSYLQTVPKAVQSIQLQFLLPVGAVNWTVFGNNTSDNQHGTVSTTLFSRTYPCFLACPSLTCKGLLHSSWAFLTVYQPRRSVSRSRLSQAHPCLEISLWMLECLGPFWNLDLQGHHCFWECQLSLSYPAPFC